MFVEVDHNKKPNLDEIDASQNSENMSENANSVLESQASIDATSKASDLLEKRNKAARRLTCKEIFCCMEKKNIIL